jgi:hypothetical protein
MNKILIISFICSISFGILSGAEQKFTFDKEAYSFDNIVQEELFYSLLVENAKALIFQDLILQFPMILSAKFMN